MSFHGGLIGVLLAVWWFSRRQQVGFFRLMDFIAPLVPIGLGARRIGNFINAELWGRATDVPWALGFPPAPRQLPRLRPSPFRLPLEGVARFLLFCLFSGSPRQP